MARQHHFGFESHALCAAHEAAPVEKDQPFTIAAADPMQVDHDAAGDRALRATGRCRAACGLPGLALFATGGTPPDIIARLNAEVKRALGLPDVAKRVVAQGEETDYTTPEDLGKLLGDEIRKWTDLVKTSGLKLNQVRTPGARASGRDGNQPAPRRPDAALYHARPLERQ
ncbi:MAG: hypothetical protein IT514_10010, partial [Burkholderiales bacterium]|nr:hypothetical protein [Burkholderiales bacterium]